MKNPDFERRQHFALGFRQRFPDIPPERLSGPQFLVLSDGKKLSWEEEVYGAGCGWKAECPVSVRRR
jgi:hypothetical protein